MLHGAYTEDELVALEADMERMQAALVAGELPERCGTVVLDDPTAAVDGQPSPTTSATCPRCRSWPTGRCGPGLVAVMRRIIRDHAWLLDYERFGVVYQDARPGEETYYSRIGWHSDWQSGPHLDVWPSTAFTVHIDATSPATGSCGWCRAAQGLPGRPTARVRAHPGRGARSTPKGATSSSTTPTSGTRRRRRGRAARREAPHRGGYYGGTPLEDGHGVDDFIKNAAR